MCVVVFDLFFFFFKQKTAYEMRISDWSSDVCSSDLRIADDSPELVDCGLRERLRYVSSHAHVRSRPRDAYSPYVARQLRDAARADIAAIEARLRSGPQFDEVPQIDGAYRSAERHVGQDGVITCRSELAASYLKKKSTD